MKRLSTYRRRRRFSETPEPEPRKGREDSGNRFVVQRHAATRLHYDFRLQIDGVLKSWAVPKGPSLNPAEKRLAMETEDHPLEYANFEGIIPQGNYGAEPVTVWDRGTFIPEGNLSARKQYEQGELIFKLLGRKLHGSFVLVRLRRRGGKAKPWLLIKHRDEAADPQWKISAHDSSVMTRQRPRGAQEGPPAPDRANAYPPEGARKLNMPSTVRPMLATLVEEPFSDPDWLFEIKWDGVRALAWVRDGRVKLRSRTGRDVTQQYPELGVLPARVRTSSTILDGEIVVLDRDGRSNFERLQARINIDLPSEILQKQAPVTYYIFDIVYIDGYDLRAVPLLERKKLLRRVLESAPLCIYADHQLEKGKEIFAAARHHHLEGVIGKQIHSRYFETRSSNWVKLKITREVDAVIGGYTAPRGSREHFGALLLGLYKGKSLQFIGGVGTGFDRKTRQEIYKQVHRLESSPRPFAHIPRTRERAYWLDPTLVVRVKYANWTNDRRLRAPVFVSLLKDHDARECQFNAQVSAPSSSTLQHPGSKKAGVKEMTRSAMNETHRHREGKSASLEHELFKGHAEEIAVELGGKPLRLTHLNKVYFPESGYTKRHLLAYYYRASKYILPFLRDRPLVLRRYPDGINAPSFFQKDAGHMAPEWIETASVHSESTDEDIHYFLANDLAALLYLTNLGCIDHNPWSSRREDPDHPDYVFFDLDPSEGTSFTTVVEVALAVQEKLEALKLRSFLKTSGATGFHIYLPIKKGHTFEQARQFAVTIGRLVASEMPKKVTKQRSINKRPRGTVMIDAYQNSPGRSLAAPYAVRAFPKAPISTPVMSRELRANLQPDRFNLKNIFRRIDQHGDLWKDFWEAQQSMEEAMEELKARH